MMYTGDVFALYQAQWLESGAMLSYDFDGGLAPGTALRIASCDCLTGSEVRDSLPAGYCDETAAAVAARATNAAVAARAARAAWAAWPSRSAVAAVGTPAPVSGSG